jgi:hypothetical protein
MSNEKPVTGTIETPVTGTDEKTEFKTIAEAKAELDRARDALKSANAEAADRRKKLKTFEDADTARQAEDKKRRDAELSEVEKLKKAAADETTLRTAAEQRAQKLELRQAAVRGVKTLKLEFASDTAEDDAIEKLLATVKFEDGKLTGLDEALKALQKDRGYLFAKPGGTSGKIPSIDATARNSGRTDIVVDDEQEAEIRQRFGIR